MRAMKERFQYKSGVLLLACSILLTTVRLVHAESPQPIGKTLATIISFGDEYMNSVELYDAGITVVNVVRGGKALDLLRPWNTSGIPIEPGLECMLVRIRFEFSARSAPGTRAYTLRESQFAAFSSEGRQYTQLPIDQPGAKLSGTLRSGDSREGWIAFMVEVAEGKPTMVFRADVQTPMRRGTGSSFRLY